MSRALCILFGVKDHKPHSCNIIKLLEIPSAIASQLGLYSASMVRALARCSNIFRFAARISDV